MFKDTKYLSFKFYMKKKIYKSLKVQNNNAWSKTMVWNHWTYRLHSQNFDFQVKQNLSWKNKGKNGKIAQRILFYMWLNSAAFKFNSAWSHCGAIWFWTGQAHFSMGIPSVTKIT